jgi:hypothetical protein
MICRSKLPSISGIPISTVRNFSNSAKFFSWKAPNTGVASKKSTAAATTSATTTKKPISQQQQTTTTPGTNKSPLSSSSNESNSKNQSNAHEENANGEKRANRSWFERFNEWRTQTSVKKLVLIHGPFFGTWYFLLNTSIQLGIASTLHYNLAGNIIESRELAVKVGMEERFDAYANQTYYLLRTPIAVNGRFIANYVVVVAMMSPLIPVKISWTLASYPFVLKLIPLKWRPLWKGNMKKA